VIVRQLKDLDALAVSEIIITCLKEENSKFYPPEIIDRMVKLYTPNLIIQSAKDRLVLVAEDVNFSIIIGTATFNIGFFGSVFVHPKYAHRGVGSKLMSTLESLAKNQGQEIVKLHSSINAVGFYLGQGYTKGRFVEDIKFGKSYEMTKKLQ
jgi:GNAT superfamily N-acetyltransferase